MKILYYIGETVDLSVKMSRGTFNEDPTNPRIEAGGKTIALSQLRAAERFYLNGLGSMLKIQNGSDTIYMTVPRIYIELGSGLAVINSAAVRRAYKIVSSALQLQTLL